MKASILLLALLLAGPAFAQQQPPDPAFMAKAIAALQVQRNQAQDAAAIAQAKVEQLTEDLGKANARVKELEPKPEEKPPAK